MLIFTNREIEEGDSEKAVTRRFTPLVSDLNVCDVRSRGATKRWKLEHVERGASDVGALERLSALFAADRPVLVYVHGNNNSPDTCFTRCLALETSYGVAVVGFSWASEGYLPDGQDGVQAEPGDDLDSEDGLAQAADGKPSEGWVQRKARRFGQAKLNAQHSAAALARFLRLVAAARLATMKRPFSAAFHSLGCHFLNYAVDHGGAVEALAAAHNVALLAGCTPAAKHVSWVRRLNPLRRVYITYTQADSVLAGARAVDQEIKLGTDPGEALLPATKYRYICFDGAARMKFGAHRYFVADPGKELSKKATLLFSRIFCSTNDFLPPKEEAKAVYPVGCTPDGGVCFMGRPASSEVNGP